MNLVLFFEGTGQGVEGKITNVTRLRELCVDDAEQKVHIESGPGTHFGAYLAGRIHGADWQRIFRDARRWFEANYVRHSDTRVFLFGFSRGALIARHFAAWLDKIDVDVTYMGLWDTVDSTTGLDVAEECPPNVKEARHALARDEARRLFSPIPLVGKKVKQLLFPGCHSDVGGLYDDNHVIADVSLAWITRPAKLRGLRLKTGTRLTQKFDPAKVLLHSSQNLVSNLFGALAPVKRMFKNVRQHISCKVLKSLSSGGI